ncbi:hypothetical protein H634G_10225 [Metarhizium anisopliae BRIP 53293]|uniref:Uncharacterized protein n=1 Tax=Metarhizium anisopliae BRIP 53293 TaxID=1291518 RepID=A0A0D9NL12_METAN|nr:hypothetical protein H634G_10225 [Metarhizium anisopliae BRIP 53293]KJK87225.1 hypothetical protein H633G_08910 [Metarhizium anisopliae BRIP 53284]
MLTGVGLLPGIAVHAFRSIRRKYLDTKLPSVDELRGRRDEGWQAYFQNTTEYMQSEGFASVAERHFVAEMVAVLFLVTEAQGQLSAITFKAEELATTDQERRQIKADFQTKQDDIRAMMSNEGFWRKQQLRSKLPEIVKSSLDAQAETYNKMFIDEFKNDVEQGKYQHFTPFAFGKPEFDKKVDSIVNDLQSNPLQTLDIEQVFTSVQSALNRLNTPSLCTEYRPGGGMMFYCGGPSDGWDRDDHPPRSPGPVVTLCEGDFQRGCTKFRVNFDKCGMSPALQSSASTVTIRVSVLVGSLR